MNTANKVIASLIVAGLTAASFAGVAGGHGHTAKVHNASAAHTQQDIVDIAVAAGSFNTLVTAVSAADLVGVLKGDGPFTVFAPTDEAFAKLPKDVLASLLKPENKDKLIEVLTYHVVPGQVLAKDVVGLDAATTVQGSDVSITASKYGVKVDQANVIKTDIVGSNGVIHVIDAVILPKQG